jgi:hypothetical protein
MTGELLGQLCVRPAHGRHFPPQAFEECLDLLLALNAGLLGPATIRANSAREALAKMCTLPLLGSCPGLCGI